MAKRRVKQINNFIIVYETKDAEYYITDKSGKIVAQGFTDQKPAEQWCVNTKDSSYAAKNHEWGVEYMAQSMREAFSNANANVALPKEGTYSKDFNGIIELYRDKLGYPNDNVTERLQQYYKDYEIQGLPAFDRIQEAICIASTKTRAEQRTIAYVIGILKQWNEHGYGNTFNEEQRKVIAIFEEKIGIPLSEKAKSEMLRLMGTYGMVDLLTTLFTQGLNPIDFDMALAYVQQLEAKLPNSPKTDAV